MLAVLVAAIAGGFVIGRLIGPSADELHAEVEENASERAARSLPTPEPAAVADLLEVPDSAGAPAALGPRGDEPPANRAPRATGAPGGLNEAPAAGNDAEPVAQPPAQRVEPSAPEEARGASPAELRDSIRNVFGAEQTRGEFRSCYEALLDERPTAAGQLVLSFRLHGGSGEKADAELVAIETGDGFPIEELDCFADTFMELEFAAPPSGETIDVRYPIELSTRTPE